MTSDHVDRIVAAVLYEGFILYPYRPSLKNRRRWTFGGLYPPAYCHAHGGSDAPAMRTECLLLGGARTTLDVRVRFLHLIARSVGQLDSPLAELPIDAEPSFRPVDALNVGGQAFLAWQEAVERDVPLASSSLADLIDRPLRRRAAFPRRRALEPIRDPSGAVVGVFVREQQSIEGEVAVSADRVGEGAYRVAVEIRNETPLEDAAGATRDDALTRSFVSTHTILGVLGGAFVSLADPPGHLAGLAAGCRNVGTWPVLVGEPGEAGRMLSSPIILDDYPRVAPESPGDLFDCTEIDEILTLRILTLTDDEKREVAGLDERGRALLERTEALGRDRLLGLHGAIRGLRPVGGEVDHGTLGS